MASIEDKIAEIEEEIEKTSYNKATQHHIGKLKAKLAKLREDQLKRSSKGGRGYGFGIRKEGHATVVIMGYPSAGKSTLLNKLTNASSPVGAYDFTTIDVIPGMMEYKGVNIQLLDVPGIIGGAAKGKGRGKEVLAVARIADLIVLLSDVTRKNMVEEIICELEDAGVRVNKAPPNVTVRRTQGGGVHIFSNIKLTRINQETAREIANAYGIHNAEISVRENITDDELVDVFQGNRVYTPLLVVFNKIDAIDENALARLKAMYRNASFISADADVGLEELRERIFSSLGFMRIFMKPQGGKADLEEPLVIKKDSSIRDVCEMLHKQFLEGFRYAVVWGKSVKHEGQRVGLSHVLADRDVASIIKK
ncbi:MAG: GTP-binding protein [Candidatus Altiarchaeota archaeon]